jgi:ubiquitin carboxyl-terminal hydrolase 9/24
MLLSRLLSYTSSSGVPLNSAEALLNNEIQWLKKVRTVTLNTYVSFFQLSTLFVQIRESVRNTGGIGCEDSLLEGHLIICRDLLAFMGADKKFAVGSGGAAGGGGGMVRELIDDFVFPASRLNATYRQTGEVPINQANPVCSTPATVTAACDLLVGLCAGCPPNLKIATQLLLEMFFLDKDDMLTEWEYLPPVGPRPISGFVGLKNAGATCYMNSVLQQLFMIEDIREGILAADGACNDADEDFSGEERLIEDDLDDPAVSDDDANRREYNIVILKQVQAIFAHLARTRLQFYVPRGLWKHFRMIPGEPVNLREQQDAVEFFMRLMDLIDEAMKALGYEQKMTQVLGGTFSDQKICKTCPHRYSREAPFSVVSVDIKNFSNLADSLHEYVKGELLDGSNAYYCERCDKKVRAFLITTLNGTCSRQ